MNSLGSDEHKIEVLDLQNKTDEIKKIMDENVFDQNIRNSGIQLISFAVEPVSLDEESQTKIDNYEIGGDQYQQQGVLTGSFGEALKGAANNANGAATGMMGIGMMNMAAGNAIGGISSNKPEYMKPQDITKEDGVKCPNCGNTITGKFCEQCGTKRPEEAKERFCTKCGEKVADGAKFCMNCGNEL